MNLKFALKFWLAGFAFVVMVIVLGVSFKSFEPVSNFLLLHWLDQAIMRKSYIPLEDPFFLAFSLIFDVGAYAFLFMVITVSIDQFE